MQEFIVSNLEDENDGDFSEGNLSLREAIALANEQTGEDLISFDSSLNGGTITLVQDQPSGRPVLINAPLSITDSVTIEGLGADNLTIDGESGGAGIFELDGSDEIDVAVEGVTLANGVQTAFFFPGLTSPGGAFFVPENASLTIKDSVITGSSASSGGAIANYGNTRIVNSTISDSSSGGDAPAASPLGRGIVVNRNNLDVINSTIANNSGTGIINSDSGTVSISNSTIVNNQDDNPNGFATDNAGGIQNNNTNLNSAILSSTIVADNSGTDIGGEAFNGDATNLIGRADNNTSVFDSNSNLIDSDTIGTVDNPVDPGLGELQNNGGAVPTIQPLPDSVAIDAGNNAEDLATDQRGEGFARTVGDRTDIGAVELQDATEPSVEPIVTTLDDELDGDLSAGDISLREAIANAESGDTITFDSSLSGGTITLALGELQVDRSVTIQGLGADNLTIDANSNSRVFNLDDGDDAIASEVIIDGLTIANGNDNDANEGGGGILNAENLTLQNSIVTDGSAGGGGGGGIRNSGTANIINSTIQDNTAFRAGGAISSDGTLILSNSTVNNNVSAGGINIISSGVTDISNSTISGNTGNAITSGTTTVTSSIIADNTTVRFSRFGETIIPDLEIDGAISGNNNLIGKGGGNFVDGVDGNIVGTVDNPLDPQLGELQNNSGSTPTRELLLGSPAIDTGSNPNNLTTDQRGEGFDRTIGEATDIGAFELQSEVEVNEIIGTDRGDVLEGTENSDRLIGLDGNDTIRGLDGDDTIEGNNGNDSLEGGAGNDSLLGENGNDTLLGGEGNDTLDGGNGNDSLEGGAGNDLLFGLGDRDTLLGGDGEDTIEGGAEVDLLDGGANNDQLFGGLNNDSLRGGDGDDLLDGGAGIDSLQGGVGNDTLLGLDGVDSLFGGQGNDLLDGGMGSDSLRGDDGDDTFVLAAGNGTDTIVDFNRGNNLLGLSGGIGFADLSFSGNDIILGDETLATLNGFDAVGLTESNFTSI